MPPRGDGRWLTTAARFADGLPEGESRRPALLARCAQEDVDERLISRMISCRAYVLQWLPEHQVAASHKTVEILRTLENLNPARAASVRLDVLRGQIGRPDLSLILTEEKVNAQDRRAVRITTNLDQVIAQCKDDLKVLHSFDWIEPSSGEMSSIIGIDASYEPMVDFVERVDKIQSLYAHKWALIISPQINCSRIYGSGIERFILSVLSASCMYEKVSAYCSSSYEGSEMVKIISSNLPELIKTKKLQFHIAR